MDKQRQAAQDTKETAWERRHEEVLAEQRAGADTAAAAARDEARRQGEMTRLHNWMTASPVGRAWRAATAPGRADERLAALVDGRNVAWRRAWARQCATDGLAPVAPAAVRGGWAVRLLLGLGPWLLGFAVLLFVFDTVGWLVNHSWFTPRWVTT